MRVISKFKDYYDVVAGQGVDMTRVFLRETQEIKGNIPLPEWDERKSWRKRMLYPKIEHRVYRGDPGRSPETYDIGYVYVLFAGMLYGGIALRNKESGLKFDEITYYWDTYSWKAKANEIGYVGNSTLFYGNNKETEGEECFRLVAIKGDDILSAWAIDNKISIAVACEFYCKNNREEYYKINPCLKDINFQKVIDPFTAFQQLEQWISGVIGNTEVIPEMPDKDKVAAHGFDRWSFRKHKLDNK